MIPNGDSEPVGRSNMSCWKRRSLPHMGIGNMRRQPIRPAYVVLITFTGIGNPTFFSPRPTHNNEVPKAPGWRGNTRLTGPRFLDATAYRTHLLSMSTLDSVHRFETHPIVFRE